ncbi:MAG: OmpA family protein [Bacteroidales bacterium]|nr:OmpA family protein [Bacteroidales bacterium]
MIKRVSVSIVFIMCCTLGFSQNIDFDKDNFPDDKAGLKEAKNNIKKGEKLMNTGKHKLIEAIYYFQLAHDFNPDNALLNYLIGNCYLNSLDKTSSLQYLHRAWELDPAVADDLEFLLARTLHLNYRFDDAITHYNGYLKRLDKKALKDMEGKIKKSIEEAENGIALISEPLRCFIDNLGSSVNNEYPDYSPVVNADESVIFFTSRRPSATGGEIAADEAYYEDIYFVERLKDGQWSTAKNPGKPINTEKHDAVVGLSVDGQQLFIYKGDDGGDLFFCKLKGHEWSKPEKLSKNINTNSKECAAAFSPDENSIYFVSDRPGGYGGLDIYWSEKDEKGRWKKPQNIGSAINTPYDENGVFMHPDGKTLYFSSKGHNTMGGYDIFYSVLENGVWSTPENLGYPVNTPDHDLYFTITAKGRIAYYASFRPDGLGDLDIYKITFLGKEKPVIANIRDQLLAMDEMEVDEIVIEPAIAVETRNLTLLKGRVLDEESGEPLFAVIEVSDNVTGALITRFESNSKTGKYLLSLPAGKNYGIAVTADDYLFFSENFDIEKNAAFKEVSLDILMKKVEIGKSIVLKNIFFDYNRATIKSESKKELERLITLLEEMPDLKLEISGHTDSIGSVAYNQDLSERRAKAVVDHLTTNGVDSRRLVYKGYGEILPIAPNSTEEGRALNRRTEFIVLEK